MAILEDDEIDNIKNVINVMPINNVSSIVNTNKTATNISSAAKLENITTVEAGFSSGQNGSFRRNIPTTSPGYNTLHSGTTYSIGNSQFDVNNFTYVNSYEELEAELSSASREITTIVSHWSATFINQNIGAEEIHQWHLRNGGDGCGYHYIIRRDGRLQRGRPLNRVGAHVDGFNEYSIGVCLIGGINALSGSNYTSQQVSSESFTQIQYDTHDMLYKAFYNAFPYGQAYGHVDLATNGEVDPGFDVAQYVLNKFGKTNLSSNPRLVGALSFEQINRGVA